MGNSSRAGPTDATSGSGQSDPDGDTVTFVVETLRQGGASVVPYNSSTRDRARVAVHRAEEIIGLPIEVDDSGLHDEGYGRLRLKVESLLRMPDPVVRAYEEAHRSDRS